MRTGMWPEFRAGIRNGAVGGGVERHINVISGGLLFETLLENTIYGN